VTGHPPCGEIRHALAVYVLGAIEPADRRVLDDHLAGCPDCRQELAGLAGLPALLRRVSPDEAAGLSGPAPADRGGNGQAVTALLRKAGHARRRDLRAKAAFAAAAGVIAGVGLLAGWQLVRPAAAPAAPVAFIGQGPVSTVHAVSQRTQAHATVAYAAAPWGLRLAVRVSGIPAGTACEIAVVGGRGEQLIAGGWTIGTGAATWYPASTSVPLSQVRGFVIYAGTRIEVFVPISHPQSERSGPIVRDTGMHYLARN
jgi:hypothetical protein